MEGRIAKQWSQLQPAVDAAHSLFSVGIFNPLEQGKKDNEEIWVELLLMGHVKALQETFQTPSADTNTVLKALIVLDELNVSTRVLEATGVGKQISKLRRSNQNCEIGKHATALVAKWKEQVVAQQLQQTRVETLRPSASSDNGYLAVPQNMIFNGTDLSVHAGACGRVEVTAPREVCALKRSMKQDISDSDSENDDLSLAQYVEKTIAAEGTTQDALQKHSSRPVQTCPEQSHRRDSSPKMEAIRKKIKGFEEERLAEKERKRIRPVDVIMHKSAKSRVAAVVAVNDREPLGTKHGAMMEKQGTATKQSSKEQSRDISHRSLLDVRVPTDLRAKTRTLLTDAIKTGTYANGSQCNTEVIGQTIEEELFRRFSTAEKQYKMKGMMLSANLRRVCVHMQVCLQRTRL